MGILIDCVYFGVNVLMCLRLDIVVFGINVGLNLGDDVIYFGMVVVVMEGCYLGFLVFVVLFDGYKYYDIVAVVICLILCVLCKELLCIGCIFNINVLDLFLD